MGRAERRAQFKHQKKDRRVLTIGFEKRFDSLTEARTELAQIWPETDQYLDTPAGATVLNYSLLGQSDDELEANINLLKGDGSVAAKMASVTDSKGKETLLATVFGLKGSVCLVGWGRAAFGWERPHGGGYLAFFEAWSGHIFKGEEKVALKAKGMGWRPNLETQATRGQRRSGNVDHLKAFLGQGADAMAAASRPGRLLLDNSGPQVLNTEEAENS